MIIQLWFSAKTVSSNMTNPTSVHTVTAWVIGSIIW